jgi:hypothetical protein
LTGAIQGAEEVQGNSYTKHRATKVALAILWGAPFATKNLALALMTGQRPPDMLRIGMKSEFPDCRR